ncbi:MAG TPA: hypothetical protein PK523_12125 [Elusimicrobiales bacterium]|nr:hypothetical protein [Elusimicrobiales bacterium]
MNKVLIAMLLSAAPAFAGGPDVFTDPSFQNFNELAYGYKRPHRAPPPPSDLRDAVGPSPAAGLSAMTPRAPSSPVNGPAGEEAAVQTPPPDVPAGWPHMLYRVRSALRRGPVASFVPFPGSGRWSGHRDLVYISFVPVAEDYAPLIKELASSAGFLYTGERELGYSPVATARVKVYGLLPASSLRSVYSHPAVARTGLERGRPSLPVRTPVAFTLKVPSGVKPDEFIASFSSAMAESAGFSLVSSSPSAWARPGRTSFTPYDLSGEVQADRVNDLIGSPFVTGVSVKS